MTSKEPKTPSRRQVNTDYPASVTFAVLLDRGRHVERTARFIAFGPRSTEAVVPTDPLPMPAGASQALPHQRALSLRLLQRRPPRCRPRLARLALLTMISVPTHSLLKDTLQQARRYPLKQNVAFYVTRLLATLGSGTPRDLVEQALVILVLLTISIMAMWITSTWIPRTPGIAHHFFYV